MYSEETLEHYTNPRNVGCLDTNNCRVGSGVLGNPDCGLIMRLHIQVDDNEIITDAKFKTYGCGCAIAATSLLTELIIGKSLKEVATINDQLIAEQLRLPYDKLHCSILAEDVLRHAIENYREKQVEYA